MGIVTLRVDDDRKALWVEAAGGQRQLSQWIRDRCDEALVDWVSDHTKLNEIGTASSEMAAERAPIPAPVKRRPDKGGGTCSREHFHRKGIYCKECGYS